MAKEYIGDGVYIKEGGYKGEFILTTENGISIQNTIILEYKMIEQIFNYAQRIFTTPEAS